MPTHVTSIGGRYIGTPSSVPRLGAFATETCSRRRSVLAAQRLPVLDAGRAGAYFVGWRYRRRSWQIPLARAPNCA